MTEAQEVAHSIWDNLMWAEREKLIWSTEEQVAAFVGQIMRGQGAAVIARVADALEEIISVRLRERGDEAA